MFEYTCDFGASCWVNLDPSRWATSSPSSDSRLLPMSTSSRKWLGLWSWVSILQGHSWTLYSGPRTHSGDPDPVANSNFNCGLASSTLYDVIGSISQRLDPLLLQEQNQLFLVWILRISPLFPCFTTMHMMFLIAELKVSSSQGTSAFASSSLTEGNIKHFATTTHAEGLLADSLSLRRESHSLTAWKILLKMKWAVNTWTVTAHSTISQWHPGTARLCVSLLVGSARKLFSICHNCYNYTPLPGCGSSIVAPEAEAPTAAPMACWTTPHCGDSWAGFCPVSLLREVTGSDHAEGW